MFSPNNEKKQEEEKRKKEPSIEPSDMGLFDMIQRLGEKLKTKPNSQQKKVTKQRGDELEKPRPFQPGDIVYHKLNGEKYLIDRVDQKTQMARVQTTQDKYTYIGVHKLQFEKPID